MYPSIFHVSFYFSRILLWFHIPFYFHGPFYYNICQRSLHPKAELLFFNLLILSRRNPKKAHDRKEKQPFKCAQAHLKSCLSLYISCSIRFHNRKILQFVFSRSMRTYLRNMTASDFDLTFICISLHHRLQAFYGTFYHFRYRRFCIERHMLCQDYIWELA